MKKMISLMLTLCMTLCVVPCFSTHASAITYNATYTGILDSLTLTSGSYLLKNLEIYAYNGKNAIIIANGANVTLYISGNNIIQAGVASLSNFGGAAGIYVPSGATLTIKKADGSSYAKLAVKGGNGMDADIDGAAGGGAAIGTNGAKGGAANFGNGTNGGNGQSSVATGTINLSGAVTYTFTAGKGGAAHKGYNGTNGTLDLTNNNAIAGAGGAGGGGGGFDGAVIGTGGSGGGAGGNGGIGGEQYNFNSWTECGGGGGGGGGQGYDSNGGGGGGSGGAVARARGGSGATTAGGAGGQPHFSAVLPSTTQAYDKGSGVAANRSAQCGEPGLTYYNNSNTYYSGAGGDGGKTDSDDHPGSKGGNGGKAGTATVSYTVVEFVDELNGTSTYRMVVNGRAIGTLPADPSYTHYSFSGWKNGTNPVTSATTVTGSIYTVKASWTSLPHQWTYTAAGNTITAKCSIANCDYSTNGAKLTLSTTQSSKVYDGQAFPNVVVNNGITSVTGASASQLIYKSNDEGTYSSTTSPKDVGKYRASVSVGDKTAYVDFTIEKATLTLTPSSHSVAALGTLPTPTTTYSGYVTGETYATAGITGALPQIKFYTDSTKSTVMTSANIPGTHVIAYDGVGTVSAKNYSFKFGTGTLTVGSSYTIKNADDLIYFGSEVNTGGTAVNAILSSNIDMTGKTWTPINAYSAIFDGNNKTITGLNAALFNSQSGTIKNLTVSNSTSFSQSAGGNGMIAYTNLGRIEKVIVSGCTIQYGAYSYLGGITGRNQGSGTILNCAVINSNLNRIWGGSSTGVMGGITDSNAGIVENCYTYNCSFNNGGTKGGIVATGNKPTNSYYYTTSPISSTTDGASKTMEQFKSGEVCYLLNGNQSTITWYQTVGLGTPLFSGERVYKITSGYSNSSLEISSVSASSVTVKSQATASATATIVFAAYRDGYVISLDIRENIQINSGTNRIGPTDKFSPSNADTLKAMLWESAKTMKPLCNSLSVSTLATATFNVPANTTATLVFAAYKDNRLISIDVQKNKAVSAGINTLTATNKFSSVGADLTKAMLLNGTDNITPICDASNVALK